MEGHRWLFEGFNEKGGVAFPQSYVKISERPPFPYIFDGKKVCISSEINITLCEELQIVDWQDVVEANLALTDGRGKFIETWDFLGVKMELVASGLAEWKLSFKQADWEVLNHVVGGRLS